MNSGYSWKTCLTRLETTRKSMFGITMDYEDFERVHQYSKEHNMFKIDDLLDHLKRPQKEAKGVQRLILNHLPLLKMRKDGNTLYYDCDAILNDPQTVLNLWAMENQENDDGMEIEQGPVSIKRKPGSGRPKGVFMITDDMCNEIKTFIEFCGTPAHERRYYKSFFSTLHDTFIY